jgi:pimeloyl-ACP methyl ester carboxylesterase
VTSEGSTGPRFADANGIQLCYETFGRPEDPVLLVIMGLGVQMTEWRRSFCDRFVAEGFRVVRFDNRDVGLSTKVDSQYQLEDMADDAAALLTAIGVAKAHILGTSMGGMIGQLLAIRHPERVLSLTSIMSTTGAKDVGQTAKHLLREWFSPPDVTTRAEAIDMLVAQARLVNGSHYPLDEEMLRTRAAEAYDRSHCPEGRARHTVAARTAQDRTQALSAVRVPTLVVHGEDDPLVSVSGGRATAAAIPGATLMIVPGMGHIIPAEVESVIVSAVAEVAFESSNS